MLAAVASGSRGDGKMMHITELRMMIADLHFIRRVMITAVDERDTVTLRNKLTEMKRKIAAIEARLEHDA